MLKIKEENPMYNGEQFDYLLENGIYLHKTEWNGENYFIKNKDGKQDVYAPTYAERPNYNGGYDIIGFEKR